MLKGVGLKVGRQNYTYHSAGEVYSGQNVYGILQAPRGDATEAIVLVAAWRNVEEEFNRNGVALALTLARYFRRMELRSLEQYEQESADMADQDGLYGRRISSSFCLPTAELGPRPGWTPTTTPTTHHRSARCL
jgi:hypothetical protein